MESEITQQNQGIKNGTRCPHSFYINLNDTKKHCIKCGIKFERENKYQKWTLNTEK